MALTNDQIDAQNFKDFYDRISGMIPNGEHRLTSVELEEIDLENRSSVVPTTSNLKFSVGVENKIGSCAVNAQGDYKSFYEQVISGTTPSRVSGECATGLSGVENVQLCSVYVVADDFTKNLLSATAISNDGATIAFELPMDSIYFGKEFYATVRYTKTNDVIAGRFEEKKASIVFADSLTINAGSQANVLVMTNDDSPLITSSSNTSLVTISNVKDGNSYTSTVKVANSASNVDRTIEVTYRIDQYSKTVNILIPKKADIYGANWAGGASTVLTRTDASSSFSNPKPYYSGMSGSPSSPFDSISPWKDMRIVTDSAAGKVVEIPKFYYKWTRSGAQMKLQISTDTFDGAHVSPAHADRGDGVGERDYVYVGRYKCASDYKSKTGVQPLRSKTRAEFRTGIHNLGANVWQWDYAMWWTVNLLYLIEYANWDAQACIGYGCGAQSFANVGYTDSISYHTGTNMNGITTYGLGVQYRYIEGLWDMCYEMVDGIYFSTKNTNIYCIKKPSSFSDNTGGTIVGQRLGTERGWISGWTTPTAAGFEYALWPNKFIAKTYIGDYYWNANDSGVVLLSGGDRVPKQDVGLFSLNSMYNRADGSFGSRLMVLPPSRLT